MLGWFSTLAWPQTREQFHEIWKWIIPNEGERESILNALLFHQLLQVNGQTLAITDSGRAFVQYLQQQGFWFVPPR